MPRPRGRRAYDRVAGADADADTEEATSGDVESPPPQEEDASTSGGVSLTSKVNKEEGDDDGGERITIVIMDPAQNKFDVKVNPLWNVARLKRQGVTIHKIAVSQQRLIFMGRMLADDTILSDAKINKDGVIIHLFPKPRVVLQSTNNNGYGNNDEEAPAQGGAHVPQISLDPDEAQMRSQILVLGSAEILDAQTNVKMLCFLLLFMTSMELLALFTIMLGAPQNAPDGTSGDDYVPTDDPIHRHDHEQGVRVWRNSDYFDLALSLFGLYASLLGIKATTENTRRLAWRYLVCTVVCGVFWNAFYYYLNFQVEKEMDEEKHTMLTTDDYLMQAFFAILIPMMIWVMCCMRAYQFHQLLEEAEMEAEQRIQNELRMVEESNDTSGEEEAGVLT